MFAIKSAWWSRGRMGQLLIVDMDWRFDNLTNVQMHIKGDKKMDVYSPTLFLRYAHTPNC